MSLISRWLTIVLEEAVTFTPAIEEGHQQALDSKEGQNIKRNYWFGWYFLKEILVSFVLLQVDLQSIKKHI